jgi:hypothetical protein
MMKRTTVRLPSELLKKAQQKAAADGRTLTALMEDGLRYVIDKPASEKRERIMPRVSKEGGGQAPGMTRLKDLDELEDAKFIERMYRGSK